MSHEETELLVRDVHPAELLMPGGEVLRDVRVFVTTRRLLAFRATQHGGIAPVAELDVAVPGSVEPNRGTLGQAGVRCELADGDTVWINRGHGCGCGSPLKAMAAPFPWTAPRA